jgi:hypothetical protein
MADTYFLPILLTKLGWHVIFEDLFNLIKFFVIVGVVKKNPAHAHHATRHNTPIHNILSTAPQLSISHKALRTLPEDGNVMTKHVGATIQN